MLKLISAEQTRQADQYTILNEPISSIELMERAAAAFVKLFAERYQDKHLNVNVFCGRGNNGGDGLAIARLLIHERYVNVNVFIADFSGKSSPDFETNLLALQEIEASLFYLNSSQELDYQKCDIVIDAVFGSGLNRPLEGEWAALVQKMNQLGGIKVSVDVPSGMPSEGEVKGNAIFKADLVITFQRPKLNFLLPVSGAFMKEWKVVNIGLDEAFIESRNSPYYWFWKKDVQSYIKSRQSFEHKGLLGHSLIIAGDEETMGAAILTVSGCHHAGCGLTSVAIPHSGLQALNTFIPEVMYLNRERIENTDLSRYQVVGIGPGLGTGAPSKSLLNALLNQYKQPLVLDADAINLLSEHRDLLSKIPQSSVLTPHMKEFDRLFGVHGSWWERVNTAFKEAQSRKIYIVLKNRYTMIFNPEGICYFNSSGSPAMASGGMGDVLTGVITSFIAQGYPIEKAILLAVFCHGYAGEQLAQNQFTISASELASHIPKVLKELVTTR